MEVIPWWVPTVTGAIGILAGFAAHLILTRMRIVGATRSAHEIIEDARLKSDVIIKEAKLQARDESLRLRKEFEDETRQQRNEQRALQERINRRESNLERKVDLLDRKEQKLDNERAAIAEKEAGLTRQKRELQQMKDSQEEKLQEVAGMSREDARRELLSREEEVIRGETGTLIRRLQEEALQTSEQRAREIITTAIQRYAADQTNEVTTSTVNLPNEEMKGRIIGREGRNIRALEAATGVDVLIDDTPEVVVVSGFDPLRRHIARETLEKLIADGRIHPARIEETVSQVREQVEDAIRRSGENAVYELGLQGVKPELLHLVGRLKFRHSFAQNVLQHSIEMAHMMGMMAAELKLDTDTAKRIGLFHDIGKAVDHQVEGGHAIIGADLLKKHGEPAVVYNAVGAHHAEVEPESLYASLAAAADAITASRPGARAETTQLFLKRLSKLEEIANSFRGVEKSFAIQAGREIRIMVTPGKINDDEAMQLARNVARQVESHLEYPGQIKVTVIRETRCIEYAR